MNTRLIGAKLEHRLEHLEIKKYFISFDIHHNAKGPKLMADVFLKKFIPTIENQK